MTRCPSYRRRNRRCSVRHHRRSGDEAEAADAIGRAVKHFGRVDVLFNNAGISGVVAPVHELPVAAWDDIVRVNLRSMFLVLRATLRTMIDGQRLPARW